MSVLRHIWRIVSLRSLRFAIINRVELSSAKTSWSKVPRINGLLRIQGKGRIQFGKNVKINSGKNYNIIGGDTRTALVVKKNARLVIGDNCGISNCSIVCHEFVQLGKDVKIGGGVKIYDTDFHQLDAHLRRDAKTDIGRTKPVFIDDDAFIGAHSIILKGSYVGKGAIIGAGSVVRGRVPDNEIWTGNPAKFVRKIH